MITTDTRQDFTWTTNLDVKPEIAPDYACLVSAAYSSIVKEVALPMSSNFEQCRKWLRDNIGNSIILSMIELYKELKKELSDRQIGLSDDFIQDWIRTNANSIKLANNYRNNLELVITELTKNETDDDSHTESDTETSNNNQENNIIDVDFTEENKANSTEVLDKLSKKMDNIKDGIKNMNAGQGINFADTSFVTVPVKILSTDVYGHTVETGAGYVGSIALNELLPAVNGMNQISIEVNNRIYFEWKTQKQNEQKNATIQGILSSIDTTKYSVVKLDPISHGVWEMVVQTSGKNVSIGIDEGTILTTDNKFIKVDDEDLNKEIGQMRRYFVSVSEKDFINNICANAYDKEYLNKINLIPNSEQLDKYMGITPMKPEIFRMVSKIIIGNPEVIKEIKEAAANSDIFVLSEKSTIKNISMENKDKIITIKNAKVNIQKKVS